MKTSNLTFICVCLFVIFTLVLASYATVKQGDYDLEAEMYCRAQGYADGRYVSADRPGLYTCTPGTNGFDYDFVQDPNKSEW